MRPLLIAIVLTLCGCGDEYKLPFTPKYTYKVACVTVESEIELIQEALEYNFDLMVDITVANHVVESREHFCELVKDVRVRVYNRNNLFCKDGEDDGTHTCFVGYDSPTGGVQMNYEMDSWLHEYFHHFDTVWLVIQSNAHAHWKDSGYYAMSDLFYENMKKVTLEKPKREDP